MTSSGLELVRWLQASVHLTSNLKPKRKENIAAAWGGEEQQHTQREASMPTMDTGERANGTENGIVLPERNGQSIRSVPAITECSGWESKLLVVGAMPFGAKRVSGEIEEWLMTGEKRNFECSLKLTG